MNNNDPHHKFMKRDHNKYQYTSEKSTNIYSILKNKSKYENNKNKSKWA